MILAVDPGSPVPSYEQVRGQIAGMIASGLLEPDAQLPSIRQLAGDLGLAPGTVARAYAELERAGLVGGRGRRGTRVMARASRAVDPAALAELLDDAARAYVLRVRQAGADPRAALDAVARSLAALDPPDSPVAAHRGQASEAVR